MPKLEFGTPQKTAKNEEILADIPPVTRGRPKSKASSRASSRSSSQASHKSEKSQESVATTRLAPTVAKEELAEHAVSGDVEEYKESQRQHAQETAQRQQKLETGVREWSKANPEYAKNVAKYKESTDFLRGNNVNDKIKKGLNNIISSSNVLPQDPDDRKKALVGIREVIQNIAKGAKK